MLVVLGGEIQEDGRVYRTGDIRISAATDRHFLRFARRSRCLIIEGGVPELPFGVRLVLRMPALVDRFRTLFEAGPAIELAGSRVLSDALAEVQRPAWLTDLESRLAGGEFAHVTNVGWLARRVGVSREHLARSYQRYCGTSVTTAIRARRLRHAYDLITVSSEPLAGVADICGFSDQSHMTRQFGAWIGRTPGDLRRGCDITSVQDAPTAVPV